MKYQLKLNVGDGLGFDQNNKLSVRYAGNNIQIIDTGTDGQKGLHVDDLTGKSGSSSDNWSTETGPGTYPGHSRIDDFVDINRDVTGLIFTFGLFKAGSRSETQIAYTSTVKTMSDVCNEIDFPLSAKGSNWTSFQPFNGELIQLVTSPTFRSVDWTQSPYKIATEDGKRIGNNSQETKVILMITNILYDSDINPQGNEFWVKSIEATCIYSTRPEYVVGQSYSGQSTL